MANEQQQKLPTPAPSPAPAAVVAAGTAPAAAPASPPAPAAASAPELAQGFSNALADALRGIVQQINPRLRENPNYTEDSVLNPRGVVKTPWTRRYFFAGVEQEQRQCTPEEADLFEQLKDGKYHVVDGVPRWLVTEKVNGSSREVWVEVPCRDADQRASLPSLRRILREMVLGEPAD